MNTGLRPFRVFLVWTKGNGEVGEGRDEEILRAEILPTPLVENLDAISLSAYSAGVLPVGSIRVSEVSPLWTYDQLKGRVPPVVDGVEQHIVEPFFFFYEVIEDGRGDCAPSRMRFHIATEPYRRASKFDWTFTLERDSEDRTRSGRSQLGDGG